MKKCTKIQSNNRIGKNIIFMFNLVIHFPLLLEWLPLLLVLHVLLLHSMEYLEVYLPLVNYLNLPDLDLGVHLGLFMVGWLDGKEFLKVCFLQTRSQQNKICSN